MRRLALGAAALAVVVLVVILGWPDDRESTGPGPDSTGQLPTAQRAAGAEAGTPAAAPVPANPAVMDVVAESGVHLRLTRRPRLDRPSTPFAPAYGQLLPAAEQGDPVAQYQLGLMLYDCREIPAEAAELARQVEQIHQTRQRGGWDVNDPAQEEQALRMSYQDCRGIPAPARRDYRQWLKKAADSGLVEAQLNLMFYLPKADYCQYLEDCTPAQAAMMAQLREESRANVMKALDAGAAEALRTLGGWSLNEEMGTPDEVQAYAYFRAYDQVQQAAGRERELTVMLDGLRRHLRPIDLERAEAQARELLSQPNCCLLTR